MTLQHTYKDNIILEHHNGNRVSFSYYLYDEDGGVNEYIAPTLAECKAQIDTAELYNADGEKLVNEW